MSNFSSIRFGISSFYFFLAAGILGERYFPSSVEGLVLFFGRVMAALAGFGCILQGLPELERGEIKQEIEGRPEELIWRTTHLCLFWGSLAGGIYHLCRMEIWDALMLFCYPGWVLLLRLEMRRRGIIEGTSPDPASWRWFFYISTASLLLTLFLMEGLKVRGPAFMWGGESFTVLPIMLMLLVPLILIGYIGTGGRIIK